MPVPHWLAWTRDAIVAGNVRPLTLEAVPRAPRSTERQLTPVTPRRDAPRRRWLVSLRHASPPRRTGSRCPLVEPAAT